MNPIFQMPQCEQCNINFSTTQALDKTRRYGPLHRHSSSFCPELSNPAQSWEKIWKKKIIFVSQYQDYAMQSELSSLAQSWKKNLQNSGWFFYFKNSDFFF